MKCHAPCLNVHAVSVDAHSKLDVSFSGFFFLCVCVFISAVDGTLQEPCLPGQQRTFAWSDW